MVFGELYMEQASCDLSRFPFSVEKSDRLAQSVEHEILQLRVVGSSPTLGDLILHILTKCPL